MTKSDEQQLIQEIRSLRESIEQLNGILCSIFKDATVKPIGPKRNSKKRKHPAGAVEKESDQPKTMESPPGRHF